MPESPKKAAKHRKPGKKPLASTAKRIKPTPKKAPGTSDRERTRTTDAVPLRGAPPIADQVTSALESLKRLSSERIRNEMGPRYGIAAPPGAPALKAFGVSMANMKLLAKQLKKGKANERSHELATALWETGWYEARMVASMVDEPTLVTSDQMDRWCRDFDNWGICDTVCFKLFDSVAPELAFRKVELWSRGVAGVPGGHDEFVKRGAMALLACVALHSEMAEDRHFLKCLPLAERAAIAPPHERDFVKKGAIWALRAIGGRSPSLKSSTVAVARRLAEAPEATAKWVGKTVLRELK